MNTDMLLKALEEADAEIEERKATPAGTKKPEHKVSAETPVEEEVKFYPQLETLELAAGLKGIPDGQKVSVGDISVYKYAGIAVDMNTLDTILERAKEELAESWMVACYPAAAADSSVYSEKYLNGASAAVCMEQGATMRVVYCTRHLEEIDANFVMDDLMQAIVRTANEYRDSGRLITETSPLGIEYLSIARLDTVALDMLMQYTVFKDLALA